MRGLEGLERRLVGWMHGSPHQNYRQPVWRNVYDDISDKIAWSSKFPGDPNAATFTSRKWRKVAVVGIDPFVWSDMVQQCPEGVPALIFKDEELPLRVGYLSSHDDLGQLKLLRRVGEETYPYPAHGLRVGKLALQFTIGLATSEGLLTPPQDAIISQGPIDVATVGQVGSNYEHMYFSS